MEISSVIGMIPGVGVPIYLTFKAINGFVASLVGAIIVIVSSGLPFWGTLTGTYAASLGSTFGSYLFLFTIGSAYSLDKSRTDIACPSGFVISPVRTGTLRTV